METSGNPYLNFEALWSRVGCVRLLQLLLGCTTFSLVQHQAGFSAAYGAFCIFVWCFCFALTTIIVIFELTRLQSCLRNLSWGNFTATFAMLATLMTLTAAVIYPLYFVSLKCNSTDCSTRNYRLAVAVCAGLLCLAYSVEIYLTRARPGQSCNYMATASGLLKVVQAFVACVIFGALATESQYKRYVATQWCVVVYSFCFAVTVLVILMNVTGRAVTQRCPFERFVVVYTVLAIVMYMSASVIWPVYCFDSKYGSPKRPSYCAWGRCPWDSQLVVTIFTHVNLVLYIADLAYTQRLRFVSHA
ncbi:myeloid-associated differentiation marker-like protein 2 [Spea bombifrons]|uniref:myeloid-associated differentiation marker-like protein 2 n=1 Tax=Spea bombifrons TaxID=233779 RepID=UPI00234BA1B2|nr:myeloid-associated differentiation marker-like protein 2 [Spea bombifrons]